MNHSIFAIALGICLCLSRLNMTTNTAPNTQKDKPITVFNINGQELAEKLQGAVENRLLSPLRKKDHRSQRMFSRCPSGYDMQFAQVNYTNGTMDIRPGEDGLYYGQIDYYHACDGDKVCEFRVNSTTLSVEARLGLNDEFVPAKQWLSMFENEKGSAM